MSIPDINGRIKECMGVSQKIFHDSEGYAIYFLIKIKNRKQDYFEN
jgi:hypothetical protein